jgi:hypothetical protein
MTSTRRGLYTVCTNILRSWKVARIIGFRAAIGALGMLIAALALVATAASAGATSAPSVKVSPHKNLAATATVAVSGKNLGASREVQIAECWSGDKTGNGCSRGPAFASTSRKGTLASTPFSVSSSYASLGDGTVTCTTAAPCLVMVADASTGTELGAVRIRFKS